MFLPQMVPLLLLLNPHIRKTFHLDLLLVLKNLHPHLLIILKTQKNLHPHIRKVHKIFHPHLLLVLKKQKNLHPHICKRHQIFHPHHHTHHHLLLILLLLMKPNRSAKNNHAKAGTSGPNTSVIGPGETPLLPVNQSDVLAGADKSGKDTSKKVVGTSGPNTVTPQVFY
jgi:hypothetical protein